MRLKVSRTSIFVCPCQFLARANSPEEAISQDPDERQEKECSINDGEKPRESPQASGNPEAGITATSSVPPAGRMISIVLRPDVAVDDLGRGFDAHGR